MDPPCMSEICLLCLHHTVTPEQQPLYQQTIASTTAHELGQIRPAEARPRMLAVT